METPTLFIRGRSYKQPRRRRISLSAVVGWALVLALIGYVWLFALISVTAAR